jgi:hypothetical protein
MLKSLAKRLPHPLLMRLHQRYQLARQSALAREISGRTGLPLLETLDLTPLKSSDTVFILGSGWSINEIGDERWKVIGRHDSIAMNFWPAHAFVPGIYLFENVARSPGYELVFDALQGLLQRRTQDYRNTVKIVSELQPLDSRQLILEIPPAFRPNLYVGYSAGVVARTQQELIAGLRYLCQKRVFAPGDRISWHFKYQGSVTAAISLAVRMNYRRIVLCGVDLGNAEYFYQHRQKYPEACNWEFAPRDQPHLMARRYEWGLPAQEAIYLFTQEVLDPAGIELFVENRSSKLFPRIPEASPQLFEQLAAFGPKCQRQC